jgi:UDP-2,3-diacylglucosamine pyrophosphatase LpxH
MKRDVNVVVISDVYLGTYGCQAKPLLNYLKSIRPEILVLNGDIFDTWQFKKSYFPEEHLQVISRILKLSTLGTKVYYLTGNHDDVLRKFADFNVGNIKIKSQLELILNGKKHWFFHGDVFDTSLKYSKSIAKIGGRCYDLLIRFNRTVNKVRRFFGLGNMSFSAKMKAKVKNASKMINDFETSAVRIAAEREMHAVVCGHIHRAMIREERVEDKVITYLNSGDWVESLTALEYHYGEWRIYQYDPIDFVETNPKLRVGGQKQWKDDDIYPSATTVVDTISTYSTAFRFQTERSEK